jgi:hypothetical protein
MALSTQDSTSKTIAGLLSMGATFFFVLGAAKATLQRQSDIAMIDKNCLITNDLRTKRVAATNRLKTINKTNVIKQNERPTENNSNEQHKS